jgi:hypothetical protein
MLRLLKGAYPSFDPAISGAYYRDEFTRSVGLHGRVAVEDGLREALRDTKRKDASFAPSIPVILGYVRAEAERVPAERDGADPGCRECSGNGWILNAQQRAVRCECWKARLVTA